MKLNPSEISNLIRSRIENFEALTQARTEGTVVSVTDGADSAGRPWPAAQRPHTAWLNEASSPILGWLV